jgi:rare lipoprotein A
MLALAAGCAHPHHVAHRTPAPPLSPSTEPPPSNPAPTPPVRTQPGAAASGEYLEEGVASWYGVPFNGHRTSNGEIYDMNQFTAAHRTLPFDTVVRVTNLRNGKQIEVRINDRGPFVANRIIDLSLAAAQAIDLVGAGTGPVRLENVSGPNPEVGFFAVQVGAFQAEENAERLRDRLQPRYGPVSIEEYDSPNGIFYRVRVGRLQSEDAAKQLGGQLRSEGGFSPLVVRLDN